MLPSDTEFNTVWQGNGALLRFLRLPASSKIFLSIVVFQMMLSVMEQLLVTMFTDTDATTDDWWFFGLMIINVCFSIYFVSDSVLNQNRFEMYAFLFSSTLFLVREVVEFVWKMDILGGRSSRPSNTTLPFVILFSVFQLIYFYLARKCLREYHWLWYKKWGSNRRIQQMLSTYHVFVSLSKCGILLTMLMLFTGLVYMSHSAWAWTFSVSVVVAELVSQRVGRLAMRQENLRLARAYQAVLALTPCYIIWQLAWVKFYTSDSSNATALLVKVVLLGTLTLLCRVLVCAWSHMVVRNFGKGLRGNLSDSDAESLQPDLPLQQR